MKLERGNYPGSDETASRGFPSLHPRRRLGVMAPKKLDAPFWLDGVQFQLYRNIINSVRGQGSKGITIKVPAAGWTEAQRDAKIRATPGFAELKASVSTASSEQPDDGEQRPDAQTKNAVGKREFSSLGKAEPVLPQDARRVSTKPDAFMHSEYSERDDYKSRNLGSRNGRVRDVSYAEATQKLEEMGLQAEAWLHEVRRVCTQMDIVIVCLHVAFVVCASRCAVCVRGSQFSLPSGVARAFAVHDESICAHALV